MYILSRPDEIQLRKLKELNKAVSKLLTFYRWDQGEKRRDKSLERNKRVTGFLSLGIKEELPVALVMLIH